MDKSKITKQNGNIAFEEEAHIYYDVTQPDQKFISVTTLIHNFTNPFDKEFWSSYKALEKLLSKDDWAIEKKSLLSTKKFDKVLLEMYEISENDFNREQQAILDAWDEENRKSCERGTKIHSDLENSLYGKRRDIDLAKYQIGGKFECIKDHNELDLEYGVYPEYLIHRVSEDGKLRIAGQIDLLVKKGNKIIIADYKGLPLDTEIPTLNGWKTMETLNVGDKVFDKDGKACNVVVKSEVHYNPCYKINFSKHFSITADCDHRWFVYFKTQKNGKYKGINREVIMTTKELFDWVNSHNMKNGFDIPKIYLAKALDLQEKNLPLDPYVLGLWLGDGTAENGRITQELGAKSWEILEAKGFELSKNHEHREDKHAETKNVYGLMSILKQIGVLNNKHIPDEYLLSSYNQRINLLRGLMDADGYYDKIHKTFIMRTNYKWQADGMMKLINSLGVKATMTTVYNKSSYKEGYSYDIKFKTKDFNPFLSRNQDVELEKGKYDYYSIQSIEPVETIPTQCIQVDSPSHTYLCTKHLLITHNTNKKIETKSFFDSKSKKSVMMKFPLNNIQDSNYWHYTLQLSTYAWMIQKLNPDFEIEDLVMIHFDHNDNMTVYHLPYLKEEVIKMLSYYKKESQLEESRKKRKRIEY